MFVLSKARRVFGGVLSKRGYYLGGHQNWGGRDFGRRGSVFDRVAIDNRPPVTARDYAALERGAKYRLPRGGAESTRIILKPGDKGCARCGEVMVSRDAPGVEYLYRFGKDQDAYCTELCRDLVAVHNKGKA